MEDLTFEVYKEAVKEFKLDQMYDLINNLLKLTKLHEHFKLYTKEEFDSYGITPYDWESILNKLNERLRDLFQMDNVTESFFNMHDLTCDDFLCYARNKYLTDS